MHTSAILRLLCFDSKTWMTIGFNITGYYLPCSCHHCSLQNNIAIHKDNPLTIVSLIANQKSNIVRFCFGSSFLVDSIQLYIQYYHLLFHRANCSWRQKYEGGMINKQANIPLHSSSDIIVLTWYRFQFWFNHECRLVVVLKQKWIRLN